MISIPGETIDEARIHELMALFSVSLSFSPPILTFETGSMWNKWRTEDCSPSTAHAQGDGRRAGGGSVSVQEKGDRCWETHRSHSVASGNRRRVALGHHQGLTRTTGSGFGGRRTINDSSNPVCLLLNSSGRPSTTGGVWELGTQHQSIGYHAATRGDSPGIRRRSMGT